jgi:hypothetical protein
LGSAAPNLQNGSRCLQLLHPGLELFSHSQCLVPPTGLRVHQMLHVGQSSLGLLAHALHLSLQAAQLLDTVTGACHVHTHLTSQLNCTLWLVGGIEVHTGSRTAEPSSPQVHTHGSQVLHELRQLALVGLSGSALQLSAVM